MTPRRERPVPWRQNAQPPMPLAARLKLNADTPPAEQIPGATPLLASREPDGLSKSAASGAQSLTSPVLTILPEETVFTSAPKNGHGEGSDRPKILQEVVTAKRRRRGGAAPQTAKQKRMLKSKSHRCPLPRTDDTALKTRVCLSAMREAGQESGRASSDGPPEPARLQREMACTMPPTRTVKRQRRIWRRLINLDSLSADPEDEKIGPHLPTLLERLRSIGEDHAESDKSSPPRG